MSSSSHDQSVNFDDGGKCNLIVNYIPLEMTENELRELFQPFGLIVDLKIVRDHITQRSLGYGFIRYETEDEASIAIQRLNGSGVGKKQIKVSIARPSSDAIKNCKLYVSNLPISLGKDETISLFSQFGKIIECRVLYDKHTGQSRCTAFIQFNVREEAAAALELNGTILGNSQKPLVVKFAEDHTNKRYLPHNRSNRTQQKYSNNFLVDNNRNYNPMILDSQQQSMGFGIFGFYGGGMPWIGLPTSFYNYNMIPFEQETHLMKNSTNFRPNSQF